MKNSYEQRRMRFTLKAIFRLCECYPFFKTCKSKGTANVLRVTLIIHGYIFNQQLTVKHINIMTDT